MPVPAELREALALLTPVLKQVKDYLKSRLHAELGFLNPVTITSRLKDDESIYAKLQTGRYDNLLDLNDLVGVKVVLLRRSLLQQAIDALQASSFVVLASNLETEIDPRTFSYHQPHLILRLPNEYVERNPAVGDVRAEVQLTTTLQHALDVATHDFDYKGKSFAWANFRLVAQLRGSLELVDNILDDIESSAKLGRFDPPPPVDLTELQNVLDAMMRRLRIESFPEDYRRMTSTVAEMLSAADVSVADLEEMCERNGDLVTSVSLTPPDIVLGVLLREVGDRLLEGYEGAFCVPDELLTLCEEVRRIPEGRRVVLGYTPPT